MTRADLRTPLERNAGRAASTSAEVADYLCLLAATSDEASLHTLGHSHRGQPLLGLQCGGLDAAKPRLLLVGSHHGGSEPAGGEALLVIARELLLGELRPLLGGFTVMVVPNVNPDGRDGDTAQNANRINLNRDYGLLSQPESLAMNQLLLRWRPRVVLDAHESAALKQRTLGRQGYLTDFECQFDIANHPAIEPRVQADTQALLLPLLDEVRAAGLRAQRYVREISSIRKPLTHGGVSLGRFRNKAGLYGALSFLLETPMPPKDAAYPSFRDINLRVAKQVLCMRAFLRVLAGQRYRLASAASMNGGPGAGTPIVLHARYLPAAGKRVRWVPMRRYPGLESIALPFADHSRLRADCSVDLPVAYVITRYTETLGPLLRQHGIDWSVIAQARVAMGSVPWLGEWDTAGGSPDIEYRRGALTLPPGALHVPVAQANGRLLPLLLEPAAPSAWFHYPKYRRLLVAGEHPVWRMERERLE